MSRIPVLLVLLLLSALPLFADDADLGVTMRITAAPFWEQQTPIDITVTNYGPSRATNVAMESPQPMDYRFDSRCQRFSNDPEFRCVAPSIEPGQSTTFTVKSGSHSTVLPYIIPVDVHADQRDPNPANDHDSITIDYVENGSVTVTLAPPAELDADNVGTARITIENRAQWDMTSAALQFQASNLARIVRTDPEMPCLPNQFFVACTLPTIPARSTREITFELQFKRESETSFWSTVQWGSQRYTDSKLVTYFEAFGVTHAGDAGPGSLRQAILDANAGCADPERVCRIEFSTGDATIRPLTPLPAISAMWVVIDGAGRIAIEGGEGNGLVITGARAEVRGMAIRGLAANGILIERPGYIFGRFVIANCVIERNGGRGVMAMPNGDLRLTDNILADNARSGAFVLAARGMQISGNRFTGNGASGIYIGTRGHTLGIATMSNNVIEDNREFGIALGVDSIVIVGGNRIAHNGWGGIDIGLDGPTEQIIVPVLRSAHFDGAATIIEGNVKSGGGGSIAWFPVAIDLYASSDGDGEGEELVGTAKPDGAGNFVLRIEHDLRGQWITAINVQRTSYFGGEYNEDVTSEFSRAVKVD